MTPEDPRSQAGDDPVDRLVAGADPAPREELENLPLHQARTELRAEIEGSGPAARPARESGARWRRLVPVLAAAAVVAVAGGIWWATASPDNPDDPERSPAAAESSDPADSSASAEPSTSGSASPKASGDSATPRSSQNAEPKEHYMMPPRPLVLTAPGWKPDVVDGDNVTWAGPGGGRVEVSFIVYAGNEDPFDVGSYPQGTEISALGVPTRLTAYQKDGRRHQVAITSPVLQASAGYSDGTAVTLEGTALTDPAFRTALDSAQWVSLDQYDKVVKPAIG